MARILSIAVDPEILSSRNRALVQRGHDVHGATTRTQAIAAAKSQQFDVVLLCNSFPEGYSHILAQELTTLMPRTTVVQIKDDETSIREIEEIIRSSKRRSLLKAA